MGLACSVHRFRSRLGGVRHASPPVYRSLRKFVPLGSRKQGRHFRCRVVCCVFGAAAPCNFGERTAPDQEPASNG
jgi:hypothetical protein